MISVFIFVSGWKVITHIGYIVGRDTTKRNLYRIELWHLPEITRLVFQVSACRQLPELSCECFRLWAQLLSYQKYSGRIMSISSHLKSNIQKNYNNCRINTRSCPLFMHVKIISCKPIQNAMNIFSYVHKDTQFWEHNWKIAIYRVMQKTHHVLKLYNLVVLDPKFIKKFTSIASYMVFFTHLKV